MRGRLTTATKARVRRMWSVALSAGTVYALVLLFRWHDYNPLPPHRSHFDDQLLATMGVAYFITAVVMLLFNESWPLRAHGQLYTYLADAGLWGSVGFSRLGYRHALTVDELTKIRACFIVGVTCLVLGLAWYGIVSVVEWRHRRRSITLPSDCADELIAYVPVERRSGTDRRRGWGRLT